MNTVRKFLKLARYVTEYILQPISAEWNNELEKRINLQRPISRLREFSFSTGTSIICILNCIVNLSGC